MTRKTNKKAKRERRKKQPEYTSIMILFTLLFAVLTVYLVNFQWNDSREVINNTYNARLDKFEHRVIRGSIQSADGELLAYTEVSEDGTEKRKYPFGCTFSQVLGYSEYGKTGIEELANFQLLQSNAYFFEKVINEVKEQKNIGDTVVTTLDSRLQNVAHDALGTRDGAVVVMDVKTGDILAMVSKPDYNPEEIKARWNELSTSKDGILLNRATQGLYPPGSTFKTITLLEYLREHGMEDQDFAYTCEGKVHVGNSSISCYHGKKHGELDLRQAYAKSCNSAFAEIGRNLNLAQMNALSDQLLFQQELPLDLPYSKSMFSMKESDYEAVRMMTAIGQGNTLVTPIHMTMLMAAIANDGVLMKPRFLLRTENYTGSLVETYGTEEYGALMTQQEAQILQSYMKSVVEEGTATGLKSDAYEAYGKTGTAEYSSDKSKSHAWFTGYAKTGDSTIAVCVLVEGAGSGSDYAVPIAKRILDVCAEME